MFKLMMAEIVTHFPPQTYSSSFFLNSLDEDETIQNKSRTIEGSTALLDCFITKTNNKDLDVSKLWRSNVKSESTPTGIKRWRKSSTVKRATKNADNHYTNVATNNGKNEEMSLLKFLAINALDLSAPATDVLLKSRSSNWFQLSGHPDSLAPAGPGTVWKKRSTSSDDTERKVYEQLSQIAELEGIVPKYYRQVDYQGEKFIELQDLLHGFQDPHVIDIKMGTRTFLESEVSKTTARSDLYQKMISIDPTAPTAEEHRAQAVTKLRYMQFRELQSSSCNYGFRIEAMKQPGSPPITDLKRMKNKEEVLATLELFLGARKRIQQRLVQRLREIRATIEACPYFCTHEVIGSSIFMIYDKTKVGVWLIDFAKTNQVPQGMTIDHRSEWVPGNHEEGLLFGFDQLITMIEEVMDAKKSLLRETIEFYSTPPTVKVKS